MMVERNVVKLTGNDVAQIVEALRYWQRDMDMDGFKSILSSRRIDALCGEIESASVIEIDKGGA